MEASTLKEKLIHAVTEYDRKQSGKLGYNRNALGIYFARVDNICDDVAAGADLRSAICAGFLGRTADTCLKAVGLPKTEAKDEPKGLSYCPVEAKLSE